MSDEQWANGKDLHPGGCPAGADWPRHRDEAKDAIVKIGEIHSATTTMSENTKHLSCLPEIKQQLQTLNENLVEPATGKKQVPLSVVLLLFGTLAVLAIIDRAARSDADIRIDKEGFHYSPRKDR